MIIVKNRYDNVSMKDWGWFSKYLKFRRWINDKIKKPKD